MRISYKLSIIILTLYLAIGCQPAKEEQYHEEETPAVDHVIITSQAKTENHIRTIKVTTQSLSHTIPATGTVEADPSRIYSAAPRVSGWIKKIYVWPGTQIQVGSLMAEIHSPEFIAAQQEYLNLTRGDIADKAAERMRWLGMSSDDIQQLQNERKVKEYYPLRAPGSGSVSRSELAVGSYVEANRPLVTLTDISSVWVMARFQEQYLSDMQPPQSVEIETSAWPNQCFTGKLSLIEDVIDTDSRTIGGRIEAANPKHQLKLGMFVSIRLQTSISTTNQTIYLPEEAIQRLDGIPFVFVCENDTTYIKREINPGMVLRGQLEIRSGLQAGEEVVIEGSFLLKSEMLKNSQEEGHNHAE